METITSQEKIIWPFQNQTIEKVWKYGIERTKEIIGEIKVKRVKGAYELYRKKYINDEGSLPRTWWDKPDYSARDNGTRMLTNIFGPTKVFDFPKAPEAVKDCLIAANLKKNGIVLDFFAGSGTTLHATMLLNLEDEGHRTCILVTNNEKNICEEVTYIRNKKVIDGFTMPNGQHVDGLKNNNLRYYKTDFVNRERTPRNMRQLMSLSTDLLCIKENLYKKEDSFGAIPKKESIYHYYTDGKKQMLVIFKEEYIEHFVEQIKTMEVTDPIKVYLFSPSRNAFTDEFIEVENKVRCIALPAAIYDAYQRVLPKYKDPLLTEEKNDEAPKVVENGQLSLDF